jgi:hypothetical protein
MCTPSGWDPRAELAALRGVCVMFRLVAAAVRFVKMLPFFTSKTRRTPLHGSAFSWQCRPPCRRRRPGAFARRALLASHRWRGLPAVGPWGNRALGNFKFELSPTRTRSQSLNAAAAAATPSPSRVQGCKVGSADTAAGAQAGRLPVP